MAITLEDIKKLPPKERMAKLKEFEAEQKKKREEEEKKLEKEEEEIVQKTIDEIAEEKKQEEEEELQQKEAEEEKKKKEESLEQIAAEAKAPERKEEKNQAEYHVRQQYAQRPTTELYSQITDLREAREQRGYLTPQEMQRAENIQGALYEKHKAEEQGAYHPNDRARMLMSAADKLLEDMTESYRR